MSSALVKVRQFTVVLLVGFLAAVGLVVVNPTAAIAAPSNCNSWVASDGRGYAKCYGGSGEYRVGIACKGWINLGHGFTQWGNWARVGGQYQSVAKCPTGSWNWSPSGGSYQAWIESR